MVLQHDHCSHHLNQRHPSTQVQSLDWQASRSTLGKSCLAWLTFCGVLSLCGASETLCKLCYDLPEVAVVDLLYIRLTGIAQLDLMVGHALGGVSRLSCCIY